LEKERRKMPSATKGAFWKKPPWNPKNFNEKVFAEFDAFLLFLNRAICHVGPYPMRRLKSIFMMKFFEDSKETFFQKSFFGGV